MARQLWISRQEAEELVDLLEHEFRAGRQSGRLADFAAELREAFGMTEQPAMAFGEDPSLPPHVGSDVDSVNLDSLSLTDLYGPPNRRPAWHFWRPRCKTCGHRYKPRGHNEAVAVPLDPYCRGCEIVDRLEGVQRSANSFPGYVTPGHDHVKRHVTSGKVYLECCKGRRG